MNTEKNVLRYILKKVEKLLIPFLFFVIISIAFEVVSTNCGLKTACDMIYGGVIQGAVRNHYFAGSLWFLSCLFMMEVFVIVMDRFLNRYFVLCICYFFYVYFWKFCELSHIYPSLWYNLDSVLCYSIYYAVGYCAFPLIHSLFSLKCNIQKIIFIFSGMIAFVYSALVFWGHDPFNKLYKLPVLNAFFPIIGVMLSIWLVLVISRIFANISSLSKIGANTLYMCGNEHIIKKLVPSCISILGLEITLHNPVSTYMYTICLLVLVDKLLVSPEKKIICLLQTKILKNYKN